MRDILQFRTPVRNGKPFLAISTVVALALFGAGTATAQLPSTPLSRDANGNTTVRAFRAASAIHADGHLDEQHYAVTQPIDQLIQGFPNEGAAPTQRTEVWIAYDDDNLYVAAKVWDTAGKAGWVANEMRRDAAQLRSNDSFGVYLDTFNDGRNSVGFFVNPIGGFADVQITNESSPNFDWNPIWDLGTSQFDGGYIVEMAIPFKSLRYRPGQDQVWGIQFRRSVLRLSEWDYLTPLPIQVTGGGSNGVFRVSMYAKLVGIEAPPAGRNIEIKPFVTSRLTTDRVVDPSINNDFGADAGVDLKYAVTQNLSLALTANTDFAQVEVDEQQVNLTRFNLQLPEKRDFFLEGQGIFNFGTGGTGPGTGGTGSGPTLFYSRRIGLQGSTPLKVLGGGRLTGKVGSFDVGLLSVQTAEDRQVGAPNTNFSVLRVKRDLFGRSNVGVLLQNRTESVRAPGEQNRAWGVDGAFGLSSDLYLTSYYTRSNTPGLDGNDQSYRGRLLFDGDLLGGEFDYLVVGDDFNPEIGSVRRSGFRQTAGSARYSPRPQSSWLRQITFQGDLNYFENDKSGFVESRDRGGRVQLDMKRGDWFRFITTNNYEFLPNGGRFSGIRFGAGSYSWMEYQLSYQFGPQRPYQGNVSFLWGGFYTGEHRLFRLSSGRMEVTPQISLEPSFEFNWINVPEANGTVQYNQHVARTRLTYTLTPRAYLSSYMQYNAGTNNVSGNFRFRWEWAPGSELFVVYTEDRNTDVLDNRWSELSNRGLVVKVTRLIRP
ncbi:MAG: carbohydrate binding family 9 domain-containing protein [Gemmatimonadota bacterium]|jgi:hypothetical protein|nr:carbohydrate binding family 9 domain-containing protein [Gemmatimonadota bacterium]